MTAQSLIPLFTVHMPQEVDEPLLKTLYSGYIGQGPRVEEFESLLKSYFGTKNVLTLNNGTAAIHLALRLAGVGPGDEVISTPMTCSASNVPILANGATIVWADIDPKNGLIDPLDVERKITAKTKAVLCVDWAGNVCDMDRLARIGEKYNVKIIEDAAHAFGATYKGKKVGTLADFTCFSLQAIKHITTVDGGLLLTKSSNDYDRGKILRWYGIDREATNKDSRIEIDILEWGYKFHMNDVAATIGIVQMGFVEKILTAHRENAQYYRQHITNPMISHLEIPWEQVSSSWIYTMFLPNDEIRLKFMDYMTVNGVMVSRVHGRNDIHTTFAPYKRNLPGVTEFDSCQIAIPVHFKITMEQRQKIVDLCNSFGTTKTIVSQIAGNYLKEVTSLEDALIVKDIRNECRKFMTHDTTEITLERQVNFFLNIYKSKAAVGELKLSLYYVKEEPVGFGLVKFSENKYWITLGLKEDYRGKGYGKDLFDKLVKTVPSGHEVWLDVLESNKAGHHIYEKYGFEEVSRPKNEAGKKLILMKYSKQHSL